jgi:hypothetical protein
MRENPCRMHVVGINRADREDVLLDLDDSHARRHRHDRVEIALRPPEAQVACLVRLVSADKRIVER